jgi:hypothetical protein
MALKAHVVDLFLSKLGLNPLQIAALKVRAPLPETFDLKGVAHFNEAHLWRWLGDVLNLEDET